MRMTIPVGLSLLLVACSRGDSYSVPAETTATVAPAAAPAAPPMPASAGFVTGTVAETIDAASYTYLRLTTSQGEQWAAVPQTQVAVGQQVTIVNPTVMDDFESKTLKRKFDHILFGTLAASNAAAPNNNPHAGLMPGATAEAPAGPPVPRAVGPNARSIAEILAAKATLKDKPVAVRARVTKYNAAILGKNWLHVEDGSVKTPGDTTLVVTSTGTAAVGDVVVVQGVVRTDKDFGAGYSYPVMIEDATLTK